MKVPTILFVAAASLAASAGHAATPSCEVPAKSLVTDFLTTLQPGVSARSHFERWVAPGYIQHNPNVATGREAAITFFDGFMKSFPDYSYTVKRVVAEGNLVAVHGLFKISKADRGSAVMDFFRVENCLIVEHWDVLQPIPETAQNSNGMF